MTEQASPTTVEEYLDSLSAPERGALDRVRHIIRGAYPHTDERLNYGIVVFRVDDADVVGIGKQAEQLAFYTMSPVLMNEMGTRLDGREVSGKSVLHFMPDDPLSEDLILRVVRARVTENAVKLGS